ncbi:MAG: hypothetical protein ACPG8W_11035 [Candidatus Promineifilaceae bacterium]
MLTDADLFAYLENNIPSPIAAQIEASAELRARAEALSAETHSLSALLYRHTCPSADELGDYHFGMLAKAATQCVTAHLAICPHCSRELVQMQRFIGDFPSQPSMLKRVKVWFAELFPVAAPVGAPRLAFRGDDDDLLLYEANGVQISIDVQDDIEHVGYKAIVGLVIGGEDDYKAQLYKAGEPVQTVTIDIAGSFIIDHLPPGEYELILNGDELLIHLQSLKV